MRKAAKIFEADLRRGDALHFVSPNLNELKAMSEFIDIPTTENTSLATVTSIAERLTEHIPVVITTLGSRGVLVR